MTKVLTALVVSIRGDTACTVSMKEVRPPKRVKTRNKVARMNLGTCPS